MQLNTLWSLRLGFSASQSAIIQKEGINEFLTSSFNHSFSSALPEFLKSEPTDAVELRMTRQALRAGTEEEKKKLLLENRAVGRQLKTWWVDKMRNEALPLREKMVCFWHNHFVSTLQKVKVNYWIYQHNQLLREEAFGNFRELTKKVLTTNAMVRYLDNTDNRKDNVNENLSRELLELFTLGIGNYSEADIKNGALALAGLGLGRETAEYRRLFESNETISYLGKKGKFKVNDLVDIIFEQEQAPYLITRKLLKWFIYDDPSEALVNYYGDYLREVDFEIAPFLKKVFAEEYDKESQGAKIKDPLVYMLQLVEELQLNDLSSEAIVFFCQQQGMDLFNQPNVKGWEGGRSWLTSQIMLQRNQVSDLLCSGKSFNVGRQQNMRQQRNMRQNTPKLDWPTNGDNKAIIASLSDRLLFQVDDELERNMSNIIKYDFDPKSKNANEVVLRLFNFITKSPEFQLI